MLLLTTPNSTFFFYYLFATLSSSSLTHMLDTRSKPCGFIRYSLNQSTYLCLDPSACHSSCEACVSFRVSLVIHHILNLTLFPPRSFTFLLSLFPFLYHHHTHHSYNFVNPNTSVGTMAFGSAPLFKRLR